MTEKEVLSKLDVFKNAILKLKNDKETLENSLKEKDESLDKLKFELEESNNSKDAEITCSEDLRKDIQVLSEVSNNAKKELSEKDEIIESKNKTIEKLNNSLSELKGYAEGKEKEIDRLSKLLSENNSVVIPDNSKMEEAIEKLSKQFDSIKTDETSSELEELKNKEKEYLSINETLREEIESKNKEIENNKSKFEEKTNKLNEQYLTKITSLEETISRLNKENEELKGNKVDNQRTKDSLEDALKAKEELLKKNQELSEKIKRLEELLNLEKSNNPNKIVKREVPMNMISNTENKENKVEEEKRDYRFGRTAKRVIDKVCLFLDSLYDQSIKDTNSGVITLSDTLRAKGINNLTDKEYNTFMERLTSLEYNNSLLFWIDTNDNKLKTLSDLNWVKNYISRII